MPPSSELLVFTWGTSSHLPPLMPQVWPEIPRYTARADHSWKPGVSPNPSVPRFVWSSPW
ncbi:hypothetical protein MY4824_008338 [Beauveria thailandica]